jgi:hypothetical protein
MNITHPGDLELEKMNASTDTNSLPPRLPFTPLPLHATHPGDLELEMNITHPGDLELEMNTTEEAKEEVGGWDTLKWADGKTPRKQFVLDEGDSIIFRFLAYAICIRKSGNDHLIPQIQELLDEGINKMDPGAIYIDTNTESLEFDIVVTEKLLSSNDVLTYDNVPACLVYLSITVFTLQLAVLVVVIKSSYHLDTVKADSADLVLVRIFIACYLSFYLVTDSMIKSYSTTNFHWAVKALEEKIKKMQVKATQKEQHGEKELKATVVATLEKETEREKQEESLFTKVTLKILLNTYAEVTFSILMLMATAIITKQQSDILSSVFNFAGLLLILDLDELAAKITPFTVKTAKFKTGVKKFEIYDMLEKNVDIETNADNAIHQTFATVSLLEANGQMFKPFFVFFFILGLFIYLLY